LFAASGDDVDQISVDVDNESSEQVLEFNSLIDGEDGVVQFDVENTGSSAVTITDFAIETPGFAQAADLDNEESEEVSIAPDDGQAGEANDGPYAVDGTVHLLDTSATINAESTAEFDFRKIKTAASGNDLDFNLQRVENENDADIIITLELEDEPDQVYYFEDTS